MHRPDRSPRPRRSAARPGATADAVGGVGCYASPTPQPTPTADTDRRASGTSDAPGRVAIDGRRGAAGPWSRRPRPTDRRQHPDPTATTDSSSQRLIRHQPPPRAPDTQCRHPGRDPASRRPRSDACGCGIPGGIRHRRLAAVEDTGTVSDVSLAGARRPGTATAAAPASVRGIDISRYDGAVDMTRSRHAGVRFVFIKATQGSTYVDPWYAAHVAAARAAGLAIGSYHFFDYRRSGTVQADNFVDTMRANGALIGHPAARGGRGMPRVRWARRPASTARTQLRAFVERVYHRTGRLAMIYTSAHMWAQVMGNDTTLRRAAAVGRLLAMRHAHPARRLEHATPSGRSPHCMCRASRAPSMATSSRVALRAWPAYRSRPMVVAGDAPVSPGGTLPIELQGLDGSHIRTAIDDGHGAPGCRVRMPVRSSSMDPTASDGTGPGSRRAALGGPS